MIDKLGSSPDPALESILANIHESAIGVQYTDSVPTSVPDGKIVVTDDGSVSRSLSVKTSEGNIITLNAGILRTNYFDIKTGGTPGTNISIIDNSSTQTFNKSTTSNATNMGKGASSGSWSLNANGKVITLNITPTVIGVIGSYIGVHRVKNASTSAGDIFYVNFDVSGGNLAFYITQTGADAASYADWTTVLTTAGDQIDLMVAYMTLD